MRNGTVGILVNPMSGRDVRRVAARASNMSFDAKRDIVARIAAGADAAGAARLLVTEEPFRIATGALELMPLDAEVEAIKTPITHSAADTEAAIRAFLDSDVDVIVSLGGDGTNRAITRAAPHIRLIPLSTGTNNVFPKLTEPTIAGLAAGLGARGMLPDSVMAPCKVLHLELDDGRRDVGMIDIVQLKNDFVGNFLPFDADKLVRMVLTRAEPDAVGMSPIGGYLDVVDAEAAGGLLVEMGEGDRFAAPLSPGLFRTVNVASHSRLPFDTPVLFRGPGVLAIDGDRDYKLGDSGSATVRIRRDGPRVIDAAAAMRQAVRDGMMASLLTGPSP